uniref:Uncharacterized protein n=1 Tax=Electrophorus electricus TaxID=8005 RepID=A0A4W4H1S2_ELEEL
MGIVQDLIMVLLQHLHLHAGDAVIEPLKFPVPRHSRCTKQTHSTMVNGLPPQELVPGHSEPLEACLAGPQHGSMGQMQEDLQHQAVWQARTRHPQASWQHIGVNSYFFSALANFDS